MAAIFRILSDERSVIRPRHAAIASVLAAASVGAGIFLIIAANQLYEQNSHRVLWAFAEGVRALAA
jgi:hypothetical protein